jgi:hypothetical protein
VILLSNGDRIPGQVTAINQDYIKLSTEYAGELKIHRYMVKNIFLNPFAGSLYFGPKSLEEWTPPDYYNQKGALKVSNSILTFAPGALAAAKIARADRMKVSFDIVKPSSMMNFRFYCLSNKNLFSDDLEPDTYYLDVSGTTCTLGRETDEDGEDSLARFAFPADSLGAPLRITMYVDRAKIKVGLAINGKMYGIITDEYDIFAGGGNYIAFRNRGTSSVSIANISASDWDDGENSSGNQTAKASDMIFFTNGDKTTGKLIEAVDSVITFKTEYAQMKIPFSKVYQIATSGEIQRRARRQKNDVEIFLNGGMGGHLTVSLISSDGKILEGETENTGKLAVKLPFIRKIKFNIYEEDVNSRDIFIPQPQGAGMNAIHEAQCIMID